MIHKIIISNVNKSPATWGSKVSWYAGLTELKFGPRLNILVGPNGSGKSTLLTTIAMLTHCYQGGVQKETRYSKYQLKDIKSTTYDGVRLEKDDGAVFFVDPSLTPGIMGGGFDEDFFELGIVNTISKTSHGETSLHRMSHVMKTLKEHVTDVNRPTLILDECDRSLDLLAQIKYWEVIPRYNFQVIVATHNPLALNIPGAHYIETESGYLDKIKSMKQNFGGSHGSVQSEK